MANPWEANDIVLAPPKPAEAKSPRTAARPWEANDIVVAPAKAAPAGPSVAKDVALSLPSGVAKGVTEMPTAPLSIARLGGSVQDWLNEKLLGPEIAAAWRAGREFLGKKQDEARAQRDTYLHKPETTAGKYAETLGEFLPAAVAGPGGLARRLVADVAVPAVASETAGQLTKGTSFEGPARFAGGLAGNLVSAGSRAAVGTPEHIAAKDLKAITPAEFDAAEALHRRAGEMGPRISGPEALMAVSPAGAPIGVTQAIAESSTGGGPALARYYADRPRRNAAAAGRVFDTITPDVLAPAETAARVNDAATGVVRGAEKARTAAVEPLYTAANAHHVPAEEMNLILNDLDKHIASDKTGIVSGQLSRLRDMLTAEKAAPAAEDVMSRLTGTPGAVASARKPLTDIENIDRVRKYFRDRIDLPSVNAEAIPKEQAAAIIPYLDALVGKMTQASPEYASGKRLYEQITNQAVEPLRRSPTGQLVGQDVIEGQHRVLFPGKPAENSATGVREAIERLSAKDPEATSNVVRQYLASRFAEGNQRNIAGANQWGGAKFAADVAGNDLQRKNLAAALGALPSGSKAAPEFSDLLRVFEAQGTRQRLGSPTQQRTQKSQEMSHPNLAVDATLGALASAGTNLLHRGRERMAEMWTGRHNQALADMFTAPDAVARLRAAQQHARENPLLAALARHLIETPLEIQR